MSIVGTSWRHRRHQTSFNASRLLQNSTVKSRGEFIGFLYRYGYMIVTYTSKDASANHPNMCFEHALTDGYSLH